MDKFIDKYSDYIHGVIHGFDRIILKGHISGFYQNNYFYYFLNKEKILSRILMFKKFEMKTC